MHSEEPPTLFINALLFHPAEEYQKHWAVVQTR